MFSDLKMSQVATVLGAPLPLAEVASSDGGTAHAEWKTTRPTTHTAHSTKHEHSQKRGPTIPMQQNLIPVMNPKLHSVN